MEHRNGAWFTQRDGSARARSHDLGSEPRTFSAPRGCWPSAQRVVTVHRRRIGFLEDLFANEDPASHIGKISADSFAAHCRSIATTYFDAVDAFEARWTGWKWKSSNRNCGTPTCRRCAPARRVDPAACSAPASVRTFSRPDFSPPGRQGRSAVPLGECRYERTVMRSKRARPVAAVTNPLDRCRSAPTNRCACSVRHGIARQPAVPPACWA